MQRKLSTIIKFENNEISIRTIELNNNNKFIIFSNSQKLSDSLSAINFISNSINSINSEIKGKISKVTILVGNNTTYNTQFKPITREINLINNYVNKIDLDNVSKLIRKNFKKNNIDDSIIFIQPIKYIVHDNSHKKSYLQFPINKRGNKLTIHFIVSTISTNSLNYICNIVKGAELGISYFLTEAQAITHETIEYNNSRFGDVAINIGVHNTYITLNYNFWTIKYKCIPIGYNTILNKIALKLGCTLEKAEKLFLAYGQLDKSKITFDKAIVIDDFNISHNSSHKISTLSNILVEQISIIFNEAKKYIESITDISEMNITISGKVNSLKSLLNFAKVTMNSLNISLYKPLSLICKENTNVSYVGVLKYIDRYNRSIGINFEEIIHTNPGTIKFFPNREKISIFKWIFKSILERGKNAQ